MASVTAWAIESTSGSNPRKVSSVMSTVVEVEGEEVEAEVKAIGNSRCSFSLSPPGLYSPAPHFWIFFPNFTICHGNSTVSAFILQCLSQTRANR